MMLIEHAGPSVIKTVIMEIERPRRRAQCSSSRVAVIDSTVSFEWLRVDDIMQGLLQDSVHWLQLTRFA